MSEKARWVIRRTLVEEFDVYADSRKEAINIAEAEGSGGSAIIDSRYSAKRVFEENEPTPPND